MKEDKKAKKEKEEKEKDKKKSDKNKPAEEPKGFRPMAFMPKGNKASVYAPTRSYKEDLFLDEEHEEKQNAVLSSDKPKEDDGIVIPEKGDHKTNDDFVIAKSSGFTIEDEPEDTPKDDDDLM